MPVRVERREPRPERLAVVLHQLGGEVLEQADLGELAKRALGCPRPQDLVELLEQPRLRRLGNQRRVAPDGIHRVRIDREVEPRGQHHRAQHAHGILLEPHVRVADRANHARAQILEAAGVVDDREGRDVVEQRVDREVAAEGVLLGRAERVVARMHVRPIAAARLLRLGLLGGLARNDLLLGQLLLAQLPAERGHLDRLGAELHVHEPEAPADDPAVAEQPLHLVRVRRRADVEVLGTTVEQHVTHAAAHQVGDVIRLPQPVEHLQGIRVDGGPRQGVIGAGDDRRLGHPVRHSIKRVRGPSPSDWLS